MKMTKKRKKMGFRLVSFLLVLTLLITGIYPGNMSKVYAAAEEQGNVYEGDGYRVEYRIDSEWEGFYNGTIILTNTGKKQIEDWSLTFKSEHQIQTVWNAQIGLHDGDTWTIKNAGWNKNIACNNSISFGFTAECKVDRKIPSEYILNAKSSDTADSGEEEKTDDTYISENYKVEFHVSGKWENHYNATITITNTGEQSIEDWKIYFQSEDEITDLYNAVVEQSGDSRYKIKNAGWNQDIKAGKSISFGFSGTYQNNIHKPSGYVMVGSYQTVKTENCEINYQIKDVWEDKYEAEINLHNLSDQTIEDWILDFDFGGQITKVWDASVYEHTGSHYRIKNADYDQNIEPGQTVSFGFLCEGTVQEPENYALNEIVSEEPEKWIELADGKITESYYHYVLSGLLFKGKNAGDISLADDYDGDGLNLKEEIAYGTDPFHADTDEDGLNDFAEIVLHHTNPLLYDTDNDGMGDGTELSSGLNPQITDTDGNGIKDEDEVIRQIVKNPSTEEIKLEEAMVLPELEILGKGDYSKKVTVTDISNNKMYQDLEYLVGHPFDIEHDTDFKFEESKVTFTIDNRILKKHKIESLKVVSFNEKTGGIELLETQYDKENHTIAATPTHYSPIAVVDETILSKFTDIENESDRIKSGKADIIFVIDTTGSMSSPISNVKNNVQQFVNDLKDNHVDIRLGLVEYRDIYVDGPQSTKTYDWYYDVDTFKKQVASLGVNGGGDAPESAVDALEKAKNMTCRAGVDKYIILISDAEYKNGTSTETSKTMEQMVEELEKEQYSVSVVTQSYYFKTYDELVSKTDGVTGNINNNFASELLKLILKIATDVNDGYWIRLSDGSLVKLDKDPNKGDKLVDTDEDGIPDLLELTEKTKQIWMMGGQANSIEVWNFNSNPAKKDSDGDGIDDCKDLRPCIYDVEIKEANDEKIVFNDGREWYIFGEDIYAFMNNVYLSAATQITDPIVQKKLLRLSHNDELKLNKYEASTMAVMDINGARAYLTYQKKDLREDVYRILAKEDPRYYKHTWLSGWKEISPREEEWYDFFTGDIKTDADANLTIYYDIDLQNVIKAALIIGVVAGVTYLAGSELMVIYEACEIYGLRLGITMYTCSGSAFTKMMVDDYYTAPQVYEEFGDYLSAAEGYVDRYADRVWAGTKVVDGVTVVTDVGAFGEDVSAEMLACNGWHDFVYIKNASNNGIDIIARGTQNQLGFFEVKTSAIGTIPYLSERQEDMNYFVKDVLYKAMNGMQPYQGISADMQQQAAKIYEEFALSQGMGITGVTIGVDLEKGIFLVSRWNRQ